MILLTHNMLASPMKEAGQQLPLGIEASEATPPPPNPEPTWRSSSLEFKKEERESLPPPSFPQQYAVVQ